MGRGWSAAARVARRQRAAQRGYVVPKPRGFTFLAVDAALDMREELMHAADSEECAICMEPIEQMGACWRCSLCGNRVHHPCMGKWKICGNSCPFCRGTLND